MRVAFEIEFGNGQPTEGVRKGSWLSFYRLVVLGLGMALSIPEVILGASEDETAMLVIACISLIIFTVGFISGLSRYPCSLPVCIELGIAVHLTIAWLVYAIVYTALERIAMGVLAWLIFGLVASYTGAIIAKALAASARGDQPWSRSIQNLEPGLIQLPEEALSSPKSQPVSIGQPQNVQPVLA